MTSLSFPMKRLAIMADLIVIVRLCTSDPVTPDRARKRTGRRRVAKEFRLAGHVRKRFSRRYAHLAAWLSVCAGQSVAAQGINLDTPDEILLQEEPLGIDAGGVVLYPTLRAETAYDTNIYNRETVKVDDGVFDLIPTLRVQPKMDRHAIWFDAAAKISRYYDITGENSESFTFANGFRFDLPERTSLRGRLYYAGLVEGRGSYGDSFATDEPISYEDLGASLEIRRRGAVVGMSLNVGAQKLTYDDTTIGGMPIDLSYRDLRRLAASGEVEYRLGNRLSTIARLSANTISYDINPVSSRDSSGFSLLGGVRFQATDQTTVEAAIGYLEQDFDDPASTDLSGVDFYLNAEWAPAERTRVQLSAARQVERSPLDSVTAVIRSHMEAEAAHALSNQVLVRAHAGFEDLDYRGINRAEQRIYFGGDFEYRVAPRITGYFGGSFRHQTTHSALGREYKGGEVHLGIKATI